MAGARRGDDARDPLVVRFSRYAGEELTVVQQGRPWPAGRDPRQRAVVGAPAATEPGPVGAHGQRRHQHDVRVRDGGHAQPRPLGSPHATGAGRQLLPVLVDCPVQVEVLPQHRHQHAGIPRPEHVQELSGRRFCADGDVDGHDPGGHDFGKGEDCGGQRGRGLGASCGGHRPACGEHCGAQGDLLLPHRGAPVVHRGIVPASAVPG